MAFEKPKIENIKLKEDCIEDLKRIDELHELGNAAGKLLAWSPVVLVLGNPNPVDVAFTIATTDWEKLATGVAGLEAIKIQTIKQICQKQAAVTHATDAKLRQFWTAMYEFYDSQL